jgi:hypothetical protein
MLSVGSSGLETELELRQASELLYDSYFTAALRHRPASELLHSRDLLSVARFLHRIVVSNDPGQTAAIVCYATSIINHVDVKLLVR